jgi:hypothetical protein
VAGCKPALGPRHETPERADEEKCRAFAEVLGILRRRVQGFTSLPFDSIDKFALKGMVDEAGQI